MKRDHPQKWIADGEKYALLGLSVKLPDEGLAGLDLSPDFQVQAV
jgi:hypothetical protein